MSQTDQPHPRPRRGNRSSGRPNPSHGSSRNRSQPSRSRPRSGPGKGDRVPQEDHRDWEPVDRGRDIRRRAAERPSLWQRILSFLTFWRSKGGGSGPRNSQPKGGSKASGKADGARPVRSPGEPRTVPPPDPAAITTPRLHVGNLHYDASESDLAELFRGVGQVQSVEIVYHRETQRSKGFAFVQLLTIEEARRAVVELHGKDYMGRRMELGPARTPGDRRRA